MLNGKGQEAAPFELLISVIIMGFVIYIGMIALDTMVYEQCKAERVKALSDMKGALEKVVVNQTPTIVNFTFSGCFSPLHEEIRVIESEDSGVCASHCSTPKNLCLLIMYAHSGEDKVVLFDCPAITPETFFPFIASDRCPDRGGYELTNLRHQIVQGVYELRYRESGGVTAVCAYRRTE